MSFFILKMFREAPTASGTPIRMSNFSAARSSLYRLKAITSEFTYVRLDS